MINGTHAVIFSKDVDKDRSFFKDVLELSSVDAGGGWLIFALPPAEIAFHPSDEAEKHEIYLMCDDLDATRRELSRAGVTLGKIDEQPWGRLTVINLPGGGELGLYQPHHPVAFDS